MSMIKTRFIGGPMNGRMEMMRLYDAEYRVPADIAARRLGLPSRYTEGSSSAEVEIVKYRSEILVMPGRERMKFMITEATLRKLRDATSDPINSDAGAYCCVLMLLYDGIIKWNEDDDNAA